MDAAVSAVVRDKQINEQTLVDSYATAITNAINALELKPADYTAVDRASDITVDLANYTDESVSALQSAISAVQRGLKITDQDKVDAFAEAITKAVAAKLYSGDG